VDTDTDLGGQAEVFPATRGSLVRAAASLEATVRRQAHQTLIAVYWKPVYKYLRVQWRASNEDAKDLTQGFFARLLEKGFLDTFDPAKSRFRTFVRVCVDGFIAKERRAAAALKRGGETMVVSLDFAGADSELRHQSFAASIEPEQLFRQEWVRALFALAVEDLRQQCAASDKGTHFLLFERYDLATAEPLTYAQLAQEFGLSPTQVTNYLAVARSQFRQRVLDRLRAATGSEEEFQAEVRSLFGGSVP